MYVTIICQFCIRNVSFIENCANFRSCVNRVKPYFKDTSAKPDACGNRCLWPSGEGTSTEKMFPVDAQTVSLKSCCQFNKISYCQSSYVCAALDSGVEIIIVFRKSLVFSWEFNWEYTGHIRVIHIKTDTLYSFYKDSFKCVTVWMGLQCANSW